jgi:hypothetical protein
MDRLGVKDWRALAKTIGVGAFVEDTVRELAEELPERAGTVRLSMTEQYGQLPVVEDGSRGDQKAVTA